MSRPTHRADGSTALSEHAQVLQSPLDPLDTPLDLGDVAAKLLAEGQGRGVLQVRPPDLDDVVKRLALVFERGVQLLERGDELGVDLHDGGDVHGGGEAAASSVSERKRASTDRIRGRRYSSDSATLCSGRTLTPLRSEQISRPSPPGHPANLPTS